MARFNPHRLAAPVYEAAKQWSQRCLVENGSIFSDKLQLWTEPLLDELNRRFVQNIDESEGSFFEKLRVQLSGGTPECRKLMAEILWILMLFQSNVSPTKKRENVLLVWSWSGDELPEDDPMLSDAILGGLGSAGAAFNTYRWREICLLIAALRDYKRRSPVDRQSLLGDPWAFTEWLSALPEARNRQLRHILPHLLFPDSFERISSERDKRQILAAFEDLTEKELRKWDLTRIDRSLLELRRRLEKESAGDIDFYDEDRSSTWQTSTKSWLLSWNPKNWGWATLGHNRESTSSGQVVTLAWRCASAAPREGDLVFLLRTGIDPKGIVAFGSVARAPYIAPHYNPERAEAGETTQFIDVDFTEIRDAALDPILSLDALQQEAPEQTWNPQSSGIEIKTKAARRLLRLWKGLPAVRASGASKKVGVNTADISEPLNLIIYGPPGTGKTYRLQQTYMPRYTDEDGDRFEFITFHQSYAYEDFVEGIRPVTENGTITYEVRSGVLRRLCDRARSDPDRRYALLIDEINRGNIAKVFGELITLVEGDKRLRVDARGNRIKGLEATLPYSGKLFGVPANLDVIGTMNTADRSIALLDTALRRRFRFEELMPNSKHIDGQGAGIIPDGDGGEINLRHLLDAMNNRLVCLLHRDQTLGHAYFTKVRSFVDLRSVMAKEILPLLQEYFYNDWGQIRLILADQTATDLEYQIVRQITKKPEDLFPSSDSSELNEFQVFEIVTEAEITPDAIRKIYELG